MYQTCTQKTTNKHTKQNKHKAINYRTKYKVLNESSPIECSMTAIVPLYTAFHIEDTHTFLGIFEELKSNLQFSTHPLCDLPAYAPRLPTACAHQCADVSAD